MLLINFINLSGTVLQQIMNKLLVKLIKQRGLNSLYLMRIQNVSLKTKQFFDVATFEVNYGQVSFNCNLTMTTIP